MRKATLVICSFLVLAACGGSEDQTGLAVSDAGSSRSGTAAPAAPSTGSAVASEEEQYAAPRVADADAAGRWAADYFKRFERYTLDGLFTFEPPSIDALEEVTTYLDPAAVEFTIGGIHACTIEILAADDRELIRAVEYENEIEVERTQEVRVGLWIVTLGRTLTFPSEPDLFDFDRFVVYVSEGGVFESRAQTRPLGEEDDDCTGGDGTELTELGLALRDEAGLAESEAS